MEVVVAGHLCLDIIPELRGEVAFEPGRLVEAGPADLSTGGAVSNTGRALLKLGVDAALVGKIGDDLFGRAILDILGSAAGETLIAAGQPTSYTVVVNLSGLDRMFIHNPGCNATFRSGDVPDRLLRETKLLHFGYPPLMEGMYANDGEGLIDLLARAKSLGATTSLDLSLPDTSSPAGSADWLRILSGALPYCDLFLPSFPELLFMLDRGAYEVEKGRTASFAAVDALVRQSLDMGAKIAGVKLGDLGMIVRAQASLSGLGRGAPINLRDWEGQELWAPSFNVQVAGTTGAGDATIAGFIMGFVRGMSAKETLSAAVAVGACCCERPDATSGVLTWEETRERMGRGWARGIADFGLGVGYHAVGYPHA